MADRREIRQLTGSVLDGIAPDSMAEIVIPGDQPFNRVAYQTIAGMGRCAA